MAKKVIKVFYSSACTPCAEVTDRLKKGRFASDLGEGTAVDLIDITSEEGFAQVEKEKLERVPSAKHDAKFCKIAIDKELDAVMFTCNEEETPATEELKDQPQVENPQPES
jgi:hypothetical protein